MNWLRKNYKQALLYIAVVIGLMVCIVEARAETNVCAGDTCGDPCEDSGFEGRIVADVPGGQVTVTSETLYDSEADATNLFLTVGPDFTLYTLPLSSIVFIRLNVQACIYYVEYEDSVFGNGFEVP